MAGSASTGTLYGELSADWTPDAPVALVFFHGYGANEWDLAPLGPMLALTVPWASLRAPLTVAPDGYAWFPLISPGNPDPARVTDAAWQWIDAHLAPDAKVVGVGFSMGGLMATQLLRTRPERVAATVVLSGFVQAAPQPADERLATERPAVFWGRGAKDRMIAADAIERTSQWLPAHSTLTERVYPGLAHGISDQEIADVRTFLSERLWGGLSPRAGRAAACCRPALAVRSVGCMRKPQVALTAMLAATAIAGCTVTGGRQRRAGLSRARRP